MKSGKKAPLQFPAYVPAGAREYLAEQYKAAHGNRRALIEKLALRLPEDIYRINAADPVRQGDGSGLDRGWWGTIALPAIISLATHSSKETRTSTRAAMDEFRKIAKRLDGLADALGALDNKDSPLGWIIRGRYTMRRSLLSRLSTTLRECGRDLTAAKPDITSPHHAAAASRKILETQDLLRGLFAIFVDSTWHRKADGTWRRGTPKRARHAIRIIADLILNDSKHTIDNKAVERARYAMRGYRRKAIL